MIYLTGDDFDNDEHIFEVRKDLHKKKLIREANTHELLTKCKNVLVYFFLVIFIIGFSILYYISISQYFGYFNNITNFKWLMPSTLTAIISSVITYVLTKTTKD